MDIKVYPQNNKWHYHLALLAVLLLLLVLTYYPTFKSIVAIWSRSDTFAHGFIIAPITLWLIWRIRAQLGATEPRVNYIGFLLLAGLGLVWLLATYVDILAIEQLAVVMMIPVLVFTLLGWATTSLMAFPLFFLIFSVPLGEELTPYLIDITADFTVMMIQLVGIPVYREGTFFQLPTGSWSVVAACSGVRYLIASVTLGVLFAYLTYQSPIKRGIFIAVSFVVPVIANGLRAFMIVMIGHYSDMSLATGVDHLIYGWLFFGIVIAVMFYVGSFWRDGDKEIKSRGWRIKVGNLGAFSVASKLVVVMTALALIVWPAKAFYGNQAVDLSRASQIEIVISDGWIKNPAPSLAWAPSYHGLDREHVSGYQNSLAQQVDLYVGYYVDQRQDSEIGNYNNVLVAEDDEVWRVVEKISPEMMRASDNTDMSFAILSNGTHRVLVGYLYYVDGKVVTNKYKTKLIQMKVKMFGGRNDGAIIAFTAVQQNDLNETIKLIEQFSSVALPTVKSALDATGAGL